MLGPKRSTQETLTQINIYAHSMGSQDPSRRNPEYGFDLHGNYEKKEGTHQMNYTKPLILKTAKAVSAIQQVSQSGTTGKTADIFRDQDNVACLASAYQADE
jgi:hypothetical protein